MRFVFHALRRAWRVVPGSVRRSRLAKAISDRVTLALFRWGSPGYEYGDLYYVMMDELARTAAPHFADLVTAAFAPRSVVDVGCGSGAILAEFARRGLACRGLEYSDAGLARCRERGLTVDKFDLTAGSAVPAGVAGDVVLCTEVAEHLPESYAEPLVDLLVGLGPVSVFTAATPGQGGHHHLNEQPHEYWIAKFEARGRRCDAAMSKEWQAALRERGAADFYCRNVMIFRSHD